MALWWEDDADLSWRGVLFLPLHNPGPVHTSPENQRPGGRQVGEEGPWREMRQKRGRRPEPWALNGRLRQLEIAGG